MLLQGDFLTKEDAKRLSPVTLAFLGDAVYALYVRERLVKTSGAKVADFQRASSKILSAHGQSEFLNYLLPIFTEEENEIFHRGRNAKKATKSKHASVGEYNRSTGLEAVIGFLKITGNDERIDELLSVIDEQMLLPTQNPTAYKP